MAETAIGRKALSYFIEPKVSKGHVGDFRNEGQGRDHLSIDKGDCSVCIRLDLEGKNLFKGPFDTNFKKRDWRSLPILWGGCRR